MLMLWKRALQVVAAQVEFESQFSKWFVIFQFQVLNSRRFQRGIHRVNLRRPTKFAEENINVVDVANTKSERESRNFCANLYAKAQEYNTKPLIVMFVTFFLSFILAGYGRVGLHRHALGYVRAVVVQALHLARRRRLHERQRRRAVLPVRKRELWRYR
jgi:hypothetical protein